MNNLHNSKIVALFLLGLILITGCNQTEVPTVMEETSNDAIELPLQKSGRNCIPPPSGIIGWWPGDGNANDIVNQHHGTMQNGATFAPGMVDNAFSFDGVDDRVTIPDHGDWTFGDDPFTIDLWVNFTTVVDRSPFVDHTEGGGETNKWWFMYDAWGHNKPSGPALRFHINSPTLNPLDAISAPWEPNTGQWYHVAVTRNGSNYAIYIDGVQVTTDIDNTTIPDAETPLYIGQSEEQYFFNGLIDEVEIYNRALRPKEIEAIYLAGSTGKCKRVTICHKPGTPAEKTLVIPIQALAGHLDHGDTIGSCE